MVMGRVTIPTGQTLSPVNPTNGAPIGRSFSLSSFICWNAGRYRMSAELPLFIISNVHGNDECVIMRLMSSSGVFLTEKDYLVVQTNIFGGSLDNENIVYLTRICFSGNV